MSTDPNPGNLNQLLAEILDADPQSGNVQVGDLMEAVGTRSFGPLLILASLIAFTPLGGIPGLPTALAAVVLLVLGQLLFGRQQFWLPQFVTCRSVDADNLRKTVGWIRPAARVIDRFLKPRLTWILREPFLRIWALGCIAVALTVPPLEIVPFGGSASLAAIGTFGLAVIADDGVLALLAFAFAIVSGYLIIFTLL